MYIHIFIFVFAYDVCVSTYMNQNPPQVFNYQLISVTYRITCGNANELHPLRVRHISHVTYTYIYHSHVIQMFVTGVDDRVRDWCR